MNESQQILYMQVRIFRMFVERFSLSFQKCAEIFKSFDVLQYIEDCYGIFHVQGDEANFDDVKSYLDRQGAKL